MLLFVLGWQVRFYEQKCNLCGCGVSLILHVFGYSWRVELRGTGCLVYLHQKLNKASKWRTRQLTGSCTLLTVHFIPNITFNLLLIICSYISLILLRDESFLTSIAFMVSIMSRIIQRTCQGFPSITSTKGIMMCRCNTPK